VRPSTPSLDAARQEADALARYQHDVREFEKREREAAEATARAARLARLRKCLAACQQDAVEAERAVRQVVSALDSYIRHTELPPFEVAKRVESFLADHLGKRFVPGIQRHSADELANPLLDDLFPEVADE
jgi:hypothetical protein